MGRGLLLPAASAAAAILLGSSLLALWVSKQDKAELYDRLYLLALRHVEPYDGSRLEASRGLEAPRTLRGKVVVLTGGTKGCGFHAASRFFTLGARVLISGRSAASATAAADRLRGNRKPPGAVRGLPLDLSDFEDVRRFAAAVIADSPQLDYLVLNAGTSHDGRKLLPKHGGPIIVPEEWFSKSGHNRIVAANHLGHFLLTLLLAPHLRPGATVVVVASLAMWYGNPERLMLWWGVPPKKDTYPAVKIKVGFGKGMYDTSKLANLLFARALRSRLAPRNVTVVACTPGHVATDLQRVAKPVGVPPSKGGEKIFQAAFVTRKPTPDFVYPYWKPSYIYGWDVLARRDPGWSEDEKAWSYRPESFQTRDNHPHAGVGPACDPSLQQRLWVWSRKAVGLPPRYDEGDLFLSGPPPGAAGAAARASAGAGAGGPSLGKGRPPAAAEGGEAKAQAKAPPKAKAKASAKSPPKPAQKMAKGKEKAAPKSAAPKAGKGRMPSPDL